MKASRKNHNPAQLSLFDAGCSEIEPRPEMVCFRGQTLAMARHFFELSCQVGRLPSLLGREFFRARVSHHAIPSFEEQVVFVRDLQLCLSRLSPEQSEVITLVAFYNLSREDVAHMLHCSRWWVTNRLFHAVDALSEIFLQAHLLDENRPDRRQRQFSRQTGLDDPASIGKKPSTATPESPEEVEAAV